MTQPNAERRPPRPGDGVREDARPRTASIAPPDPAGGPAYIVARHLAGGRVHRRVFLTADAAARQLARVAARGASGSVHVAYLSPTPPDAVETPPAAVEAPAEVAEAPDVVRPSYESPDVAEDARSLMLAILRRDPDAAEWVAAHSTDPRALALRLGRFGAYALVDFLRYEGALRVVYGSDSAGGAL